MILEKNIPKIKTAITYDEANDCVVGTLEGEITMKVLMSYVNEISESCKLHNCKKFLNDISKSVLKLSTVELYYLPRMMIKGAFDHSWKRAILLTERNRDIDFYEITARNQSLNLKVFEEKDKAIEWLNEGR